MINLKTTENSIKLLTKGKYCDDDINVTFEGGSGGGGIEEVTELPVASAENVGKIYKYQGQLYECKEIVDIVSFDGSMYTSLFLSIGFSCNYHFVDSEPNFEEMLVSDLLENKVVELYILPNGTNAWLTVDGETKMTFEEFFEFALNGVCGDYNEIVQDAPPCLLRYYDIELINMDTFANTISTTPISSLKTLTLPKSVITINVLSISNAKSVVFQGNVHSFTKLYLMNVGTLDFSNNLVVPRLDNPINALFSTLTEIRVPSALLEEFKTATNWSEYADKMVGV